MFNDAGRGLTFPARILFFTRRIQNDYVQCPHRQSPGGESSPGQIVSTPGALDALAKAGQNGQEFLDRHRRGDWGVVDQDDRAANDRAITDGDRILSAYQLKDQTKIWIITESDRSVTTLLLPDEY